jgi:hypothetical protein
MGSIIALLLMLPTAPDYDLPSLSFVSSSVKGAVTNSFTASVGAGAPLAVRAIVRVVLGVRLHYPACCDLRGVFRIAGALVLGLARVGGTTRSGARHPACVDVVGVSWGLLASLLSWHALMCSGYHRRLMLEHHR